MPKTTILVGTRKGAFLVDPEGGASAIQGPFCETMPIQHLTFDPATSTLFAASGSPWYGPTVWRSTDAGATWSQSSEGITYGADEPPVTRVWNITPVGDTLYAGVEPAGLFRSDDGGVTWSHVAGLREHPSLPTWQPGAGGLILHSIVPHATDPERMWVAISAVGAFHTRDGGATWVAQNRGIRSIDAPPDAVPETGYCVHKLVNHPDRPEVLFQQNHVGVYRSDDGGDSWVEIGGPLPSTFGFPMAIHPHRPSTAYTIPLNGDQLGRYMPEAQLAVWRTTDDGATWQRLSAGLPDRAWVGVLREAMATDQGDPAGVWFGTSTGQLYGSRDSGDTWSLVADLLPGIESVETAVLGLTLPPRPTMAVVHIPRSLAALVPGMPRTLEVTGTDVRQVIVALEAAHPGVLDRLCEPGPRIRPFINLFVDGTRADLETPVGAASVIHVVPAVAGG